MKYIICLVRNEAEAVQFCNRHGLKFKDQSVNTAGYPFIIVKSPDASIPHYYGSYRTIDDALAYAKAQNDDDVYEVETIFDVFDNVLKL